MFVVGLLYDGHETRACRHTHAPGGTLKSWPFLTRTIFVDGIPRVFEFDNALAVMCEICGCVCARPFDPRNLPATDNGDPLELALCEDAQL